MQKVREVLLVLLLTAGCTQPVKDRTHVSDPPVVPAGSPAAAPTTTEARVNPEIAARVQKILVDQLGVDESAVQLDTNVMEELQPDSLDVVEYVMAFEEEFDVEITDEALAGFTTVRSIALWIQERMPSPR